MKWPNGLGGREAGPAEGPLVILLHGFPDFSWGWRRQLPALAAAGFHVVAPDQRGYVASYKPRRLAGYRLDELAADVIALADACGTESFRLIGHDWGGLVAWQTAARHPRRVAQLVIINAPHPDAWWHMVRHRWRQMRKSWYILFFQPPWLPEFILRRRHYALLRAALVRGSRPGTFPSAALERYVAAWSHRGALTSMLNYYRALRDPQPEPLPRIEPPTLLLWGERDAYLDRALAEASLTLCREARARYFPEATHWVHLEEPAAINAAIADFFAGPC